MLKKDLIGAVAIQAGETPTRTRRILAALSQVVKDAIAGGDSVMLAGLGKLVVRRRGERQARNMVTGEQMLVPARNVVVLNPSVGVTAAANRQD